MRILVTGAKGFVGKNLCAQLNNIKDGKARCYGDLKIEEVRNGESNVDFAELFGKLAHAIPQGR